MVDIDPRKKIRRGCGCYRILWGLIGSLLGLFISTTPASLIPLDTLIHSYAVGFQQDLQQVCLQNRISPEQFYLCYPEPELDSSRFIVPWLSRPLTCMNQPFRWGSLLGRNRIDSILITLSPRWKTDQESMTYDPQESLISIVSDHARRRRSQFKDFESQLNSYLPAGFLDYWVRFLTQSSPDSLNLLEREKLDSLYLSPLNRIPIDPLRSVFTITDSLIRYLRFRRWDEASGVTIRNIPTDQGLVRIGTMNNDVYQGEFFLILDPGGDDTYRIEPCLMPGYNRYILDFSGNDRYQGVGDFSAGFAFCSEQLILDFQGNDDYRVGYFGLAASVAGNSFLVDLAGDDRYQARGFGLGFSLLGHALLWDRDGSDHYRGGIFTQAAALPGGFALLNDEHGSDYYQCISDLEDIRDSQNRDSYAQGFAMGIRPWAGGGVAILQDLEGDDRYRGDYFCQGCGFWQGWAMLWDGAGHDRYISTRYAQGCGIHQAVGILMDLGGHDRYRSWGVAQGCGFDYSLGMLGDFQGDDCYQSNWYSMACGAQNGLGILRDPEGNDRFVPEDASCLAYADTARVTCSLALLVCRSQSRLPLLQVSQNRQLGYVYFK